MHHSAITPGFTQRPGVSPDEIVIAWLTEKDLVGPDYADVRDEIRKEMEARQFVRLMGEIKAAGRLRELIARLRAEDLGDFARGVEKIHAADIAAEELGMSVH